MKPKTHDEAAAGNGNTILASLSVTSQNWLQSLEPVELPTGAVLYEPDQKIEHVLRERQRQALDGGPLPQPAELRYAVAQEPVPLPRPGSHQVKNASFSERIADEVNGVGAESAPPTARACLPYCTLDRPDRTAARHRMVPALCARTAVLRSRRGC